MERILEFLKDVAEGRRAGPRDPFRGGLNNFWWITGGVPFFLDFDRDGTNEEDERKARTRLDLLKDAFQPGFIV